MNEEEKQEKAIDELITAWDEVFSQVDIFCAGLDVQDTLCGYIESIPGGHRRQVGLIEETQERLKSQAAALAALRAKNAELKTRIKELEDNGVTIGWGKFLKQENKTEIKADPYIKSGMIVFNGNPLHLEPYENTKIILKTPPPAEQPPSEPEKG